ncbi:MAG: transketolase C-terminal domain-containing protein [Kouleothrix sp.]
MTVISYGLITTALEAADELAREGVGDRGADLLTLRPPDQAAILASVRHTNKVLIVHEEGT